MTKSSFLVNLCWKWGVFEHKGTTKVFIFFNQLLTLSIVLWASLCASNLSAYRRNDTLFREKQIGYWKSMTSWFWTERICLWWMSQWWVNYYGKSRKAGWAHILIAPIWNIRLTSEFSTLPVTCNSLQLTPRLSQLEVFISASKAPLQVSCGLPWFLLPVSGVYLNAVLVMVRCPWLSWEHAQVISVSAVWLS